MHPSGAPQRDTGAVLYWEGGASGADAPVVRVRLNGRTVYALVDTGSSVTLIDVAAAARYRVLRGAQGGEKGTNDVASWTAQGVGASVEAERGVVREFRIGGIVIHDVPVGLVPRLADRAPWAGERARTAEVILGMDLLRAMQRLEWDGVRGAIRLGSAAQRRGGAPPGGIVVQCETGLPVVTIRLGEHELAAVFDTGAEFAVYVPGPLSRLVGLPPPRGRTLLAHGLGGRVVASEAGTMMLRVGDIDFGTVSVWIGATGQGHAHWPFALLGRGAFGSRWFLLDLVKGRLWFD